MAGPKTPYAYPVVMRGMQELQGYRVESFGAFAFDGKEFKRIALQIEEVNKDGDYVLAGGMPYTRNTDDGIFDGNDELVLDGQDLGQSFTDEDVRKLVLSGGPLARWHVGLCRGAVDVGHALIVAFARPQFTSFPAAVPFDMGKAEVESSLYRYKFQKQHPALLGEVALKTPQGEQPVLQDSRFRMPLKTPFFMPDMTFAEKDFTSQIESWQAGPIRTIVAVGVKYSAFLSLFKLHLFSELVFYRNRFVIPTVIEFIFDPTSVLRPGSGIAYSLNFPPGKGWDVTANLEPLPALTPKEVVDSGRTAAGTDVFLVRGASSYGAFLVQVRVDPKARAMVPPPFIVRPEQFASAAHRDKWPWLAELSGDLGVYLDFSKVHKGLYDFGLDLLLAGKPDETFTDYGPVDSSWRTLTPP